jgi:archaellum component FlaC
MNINEIKRLWKEVSKDISTTEDLLSWATEAWEVEDLKKELSQLYKQQDRMLDKYFHPVTLRRRYLHSM